MAVSQALTVTQLSQDIAGNQSKVEIVWTSTQSGESHNGYTRTAYYYISINNGSEVEHVVKYTLPKGATTTIVKTSFNVSHKADGTGSVKVRTWMDTNISAGIVEKSQSLTLTTIPRATQPALNATSVDMGKSVTISTPRAASAFTHDLAYSFAGGSYTSIAENIGTAYNWTVPDLSAKMPNAINGTVTIRCITKNGKTTIGTKTVLLTVNVPSSVVPSISRVTVTEGVDEIADQFGFFVQNKSKANISITAVGAKGSTIKSYSTKFQGRLYSGANCVSSIITESGTLSMVTTVTDSRGRTAQKTTSVTVSAYTPPKIFSFSAERCDEDLAIKEDGEYALISFSYKVESLSNKNTAAAVVEWKRTVDTSFASEPLLSEDGLNVSLSDWLDESVVFSPDNQYDIRLTVTDWFGAEATYSVTLPTGAVILDLKADGSGIAFGKTAERAGVDFGWAAFGTVFGLGFLPPLPSNANLNAYTDSGGYAVTEDAIAQTISNLPVAVAGRLEIANAKGVKTPSTGAASLTQKYVPCVADYPTYVRHIQRSANNVWTYGEWIATTMYGKRVLWSGDLLMTEDHTATLSQPIKQQPNGICMIFSWRAGVLGGRDELFHSWFLPREVAESHAGCGFSSPIFHNGDFSKIGTKYLFVHNEKIVGSEQNGESGTASGITYSNASFTLRYIIGV